MDGRSSGGDLSGASLSYRKLEQVAVELMGAAWWRRRSRTLHRMAGEPVIRPEQVEGATLDALAAELLELLDQQRRCLALDILDLDAQLRELESASRRAWLNRPAFAHRLQVLRQKVLDELRAQLEDMVERFERLLSQRGGPPSRGALEHALTHDLERVTGSWLPARMGRWFHELNQNVLDQQSKYLHMLGPPRHPMVSVVHPAGRRLGTLVAQLEQRREQRTRAFLPAALDALWGSVRPRGPALERRDVGTEVTAALWRHALETHLVSSELREVEAELIQVEQWAASGIDCRLSSHQHIIRRVLDHRRRGKAHVARLRSRTLELTTALGRRPTSVVTFPLRGGGPSHGAR